MVVVEMKGGDQIVADERRVRLQPLRLPPDRGEQLEEPAGRGGVARRRRLLELAPECLEQLLARGLQSLSGRQRVLRRGLQMRDA